MTRQDKMKKMNSKDRIAGKSENLCIGCNAMLDTRLLLLLMMLFLALPLGYSVPTPHGIDGTIYELDGITPVNEGIDFMVNDTTTGELILGKTRKNGFYSVSLDGNDGDHIVIRTWTEFNSNNRTVELVGVLRNVNLIINTSTPSPVLPASLSSEIAAAPAGGGGGGGALAARRSAQSISEEPKAPETLTPSTKPPGEISVTGPPQNYIFSGIVYDNYGSQVDNGTLIMIRNLRTAKALTLSTGMGPNPGAFYAILPGRIGDSISIQIGEGSSVSILKYVLSGDMKDINIRMREGGLAAITGAAVTDGLQPGYSGAIILLSSILTSILLFRLNKTQRLKKYSKRVEYNIQKMLKLLKKKGP